MTRFQRIKQEEGEGAIPENEPGEENLDQKMEGSHKDGTWPSIIPRWSPLGWAGWKDFLWASQTVGLCAGLDSAGAHRQCTWPLQPQL